MIFKDERALGDYTYDVELTLILRESPVGLIPGLGDLQFQGIRTSANIVRIIGSSALEEYAAQRYLKFWSVRVVTDSLIQVRSQGKVSAEEIKKAFTTDILGPIQLPTVLEPEDIVILRSTTGTLKQVQISAKLNKGLYLLSEAVNGLEYKFLVAIPMKYIVDKNVAGFSHIKCSLIVTQQMVVIGSPDCPNLDDFKGSKFVIFFYYGIARIGTIADRLYFKEELLNLQKPNLERIDKNDYLVPLAGQKNFKKFNSGVPEHFIDILEFWSLDTSVGHPQYLKNSLLLMRSSQDADVKNMISFSIKKSFFPNNLRVLLHGEGDIYNPENQLFFLDLDEENL